MNRVLFVPGAIGSGNPITLPADAPDIDVVVSARIWRLPTAVAAHAHDLISQGLAGPVANVLGLDATFSILQDAGGVALHTVPGGGATGIQDTPVLVGADPVVAATPTKVTARTFSLNVNTLVGDMLTLVYEEVGILAKP
jgi:hypothetical protein